MNEEVRNRLEWKAIPFSKQNFSVIFEENYVCIMRKLNIAVYAHPQTDLNLLFKLLDARPSIIYSILKDEEQLVLALTSQNFDLLLIDLDLEKVAYKKAQMLTELIFPDAAYTELDYTHEAFLSFKLDDLLAKWQAAQQEDNAKRFFDNPSFD